MLLSVSFVFGLHAIVSTKQNTLACINASAKFYQKPHHDVWYRQVCQALGMLCLQQRQIPQAVFYLTEAQSVVFRHNALLNINRKLRFGRQECSCCFMNYSKFVFKDSETSKFV